MSLLKARKPNRQLKHKRTEASYIVKKGENESKVVGTRIGFLLVIKEFGMGKMCLSGRANDGSCGRRGGFGL